MYKVRRSQPARAARGGCSTGPLAETATVKIPGPPPPLAPAPVRRRSARSAGFGMVLGPLLLLAAAGPERAFSTEEAPLPQPRQAATAPAPESLLARESAAFRAAVERIRPAVVTIETVGGTQPPAAWPGLAAQTAPAPDRRFIVADGPGTGLIWSPDGLILTSLFNFVRNPVAVHVVLADGRRFPAELLARDEIRRLAMLRIAAHGLSAAEWVPAEERLRPGQWAIAVGRGLASDDVSIHVGIISGLNRMSGLAVQTDAHLSPANYGGPLIDIHGRVIGLCVPLGLDDAPIAGVEWYDSGIGFAIPRPQVAVSAERMAAGHSLRRGFLGLEFESEPAAGLRIRGVRRPSPAARADLRPGDVIEQVDQTPVGNYAELRRVLRARAAGQWVQLRIRRGETVLNPEVILAVPEDIGPPTQAEEPAAPFAP